MPENFLSIGIDTSEIENYKKVDFKKSRFRQLARALAPARLRLGGTMSDRLIFSEKEVPAMTCSQCNENPHLNILCAPSEVYVKTMFCHSLSGLVMNGQK
ncbi:unnamed protein product [Arctia plantaginis]|uniref:Uncharacterized protein n=1 Tax=Arctia plantaginis TaxID=874455 RepID=A0A8S1B7G3_ARCPL|nr:unnamed protein product [Arctia plantaginis]